MLFFLPPIIQILAGILILIVGVTMHSLIVGVVGGVALVIGGGRWLRNRRDGAAR